ncbi:Clp domain protein [Verrucomicrobia bacterium]|nr:Clp domain protein [Verrucomicrobiota bacterium]
MFDLNQAITEWRRQLRVAGLNHPEILDELENHLREEIQRQVDSGSNEEQAFQAAVQRLGTAAALKEEFAKATRPTRRHRQALKSLFLFCALGFLLFLVVLPLPSDLRLPVASAVLSVVGLVWLVVVCWRRALRWRDPSLTADAFDNCSPSAVQALAIARTEAPRFHHDFVGTEHVLLGVLGSDSAAVEVLRKLGVAREVVRAEIEKIVGVGPSGRPVAQPPYTPRAKRAILLAATEAKALNHSKISAEHILLGLLREHSGVAALVLRNLNVDLEKARAEVASACSKEKTD